MPVPENRLKTRLNRGEATTGLWLSMANSYTAEICGHVGFDWLLIDGEHSPNDIRSITQQLQVLRSSPSPVAVRPPIGEVHMIKQLLDIGAQSLLIPMVESGAQAAHLVKAVRYPPRGIRGVGAGGARASDFSNIADYTATADDQICLMLQIESRAAVAAIDDIASTDGVDCLFIGPSDLSADMGFLGNPYAPEVQTVIEDSIRRIVSHGKAAGVYMANEAYAKRYLELGATMIAIGSDISVITQGLRDLKKAYQR
jgi:4-hydroxy-2-oxoheptanedioate aldolase